MKVLITGGAGYIGSHIAVELLNQGYEVVILDDFSNSSNTVIASIALITGKRPYVETCDVRNTERLKIVLMEHRPRWIIHLAGVKSVAESMTTPIKYFDTNIGGTMSLVQAMKATGHKRVLFSSTATVYGNGPSPMTEQSTVLPVHNYGFSKVFAERIIEAECEADQYFYGVTLRYFNPIGAHSSGFIGENPTAPPANLMPIISEVAERKRRYINVYGDNWPTRDGTCERDYIHVQDLAEAHVAAIKAELRGYNVFNIGTGVPNSVLEVIDAFEAETGIEIPRQISDPRPGDVASFHADPSLAIQTLDWSPTRSLQTACRDEWNWKTRL